MRESFFVADSKELRVVLDILLPSPHHRLPCKRMYQGQFSDVQNDAASVAMSCNRLHECLHYLYFADNQDLDAGDRYAKIHLIHEKRSELNSRFIRSENF